MIISFIIFLFLLIVALSPLGKLRLNLENKSKFSFFSWSSMLFATGMGAALLYWSTVEWLAYFNNPLDIVSNDYDGNLLLSRAYPLFHWGLTGWAIYCLPTIAFAFALMNKPDSSLTFSGILLKNQNGLVRNILDFLFIGAILTGAGVGLTLSFPLISAVISEVFSIKKNILLDFSALVLCLIIFGTSVYLGIQKGIKRLSNLNIIFVLISVSYTHLTLPTIE